MDTGSSPERDKYDAERVEWSRKMVQVRGIHTRAMVEVGIYRGSASGICIPGTEFDRNETATR